MTLVGMIILWVGVILALIKANREEQEKEEVKRRQEEEHRKYAAESAAYWAKRELEKKEQARQRASTVSPNTTHSSPSPSINYSSQSSNMGYNTYPVKRYETVEEICKRCDKQMELYIGMPVSSITNTPDYSSFGIAANTPGIDLAEAQMFDDLNLF